MFTCFNNYNNSTVIRNYTGLWGVSGDGDNYGFTFEKQIINGLLFEFQNNRSVLNIYVLSNSSIQHIILNSMTPIAANNNISNSVYTTYLPYNSNNFRVEFTLCNLSSSGFIGSYNNKIIAGIFLYILIISKW